MKADKIQVDVILYDNERNQTRLISRPVFIGEDAEHMQSQLHRALRQAYDEAMGKKYFDLEIRLLGDSKTIESWKAIIREKDFIVLTPYGSRYIWSIVLGDGNLAEIANMLIETAKGA